MFKRIFKCLGAIITVVAIAIAVFLINLIWFRPWSLNLFYDKVFAEILFDHPEILSTLGLVEQIGLTGHNGKLDDESPAHQQREFDRWKRDLAQLRQYPVDRQSSSQKLSTRVLDWFLQVQADGEKCSGMIIPLTSSSECKTSFRHSWRIPTGSSAIRIAITT